MISRVGVAKSKNVAANTPNTVTELGANADVNCSNSRNWVNNACVEACAYGATKQREKTGADSNHHHHPHCGCVALTNFTDPLLLLLIIQLTTTTLAQNIGTVWTFMSVSQDTGKTKKNNWDFFFFPVFAMSWP